MKVEHHRCVKSLDHDVTIHLTSAEMFRIFQDHMKKKVCEMFHVHSPSGVKVNINVVEHDDAWKEATAQIVSFRMSDDPTAKICGHEVSRSIIPDWEELLQKSVEHSNPVHFLHQMLTCSKYSKRMNEGSNPVLRDFVNRMDNDPTYDPYSCKMKPLYKGLLEDDIDLRALSKL